jgi:hypothetical protein
MFNSDYARAWWAVARKAWNDAAATRSEREFFALVDGEFAATKVRERGRDPGDKTSEPKAEQ